MSVECPKIDVLCETCGDRERVELYSRPLSTIDQFEVYDTSNLKEEIKRIGWIWDAFGETYCSEDCKLSATGE
jgi:hypothetical protein